MSVDFPTPALPMTMTLESISLPVFEVDEFKFAIYLLRHASCFAIYLRKSLGSDSYFVGRQRLPIFMTIL